MAEYTSGSITFQGLGNGTDFGQVIEGLMKIERINVNRLEEWKTEWEDKIEGLQELNSSLLTLQTTLESMNSMNEFMVKNVESTDSTAVSATADSDALITSHTIEVNQLAQNDTWVHSGLDSETSVVGAGTLSFDYGSNAGINISVSAGTTLEGLVNLINNDSRAGNLVRASLINDGTSTHLQIAGRDLGADFDLTITNFEGVLGGSFTQTQTAQDSEFKIDGFPSGEDQWISRSTNAVNDVVEGLTLNLKNTTGGEVVQLNVTTDTDAIKENVQVFVDQVNEVRAKIQELTEIETDGEDNVESSVLTGNYTVNNLISQRLKDVIASSGLGFILPDASDPAKNSDTYTALSQIGILTDANQGSDTAGLLELDEDALDEALATDPDAVALLFAADYAGASDSSNMMYTSHIEGITKAGEYEIEYTALPFGVVSATINGEPATLDTINWTITGKPGTDAAGLVVTITNRESGSHSGNIYLREGKVNELIDNLTEITDSVDGPITILTDNYNDIINNIDDKIDREEDRLELKEKRLKERYSRLDTLLAEYSSLQSELESGIAQLGG